MGSEEYFECLKGIDEFLLSNIGRGYVIDYCVSTLKKKNEEKLYRVYVTDALKAIVANTAHYVGPEGLVEAGITMKMRYAELIQEQKVSPKKKKETRTADDVIATIKRKLKRLGGKPS